MPRIHPFRAVRYDAVRLGDLTPVTTQPYDRINPALQDEYYRRHEYNIVRIIKRKEEPGRDVYQDAAAALEDWLRKGILVREAKPALYAYYQIHKTPQGERVRKGLSAMVRIEEPGKGKVRPHEETHTGPKIDRFKLLNATRTHTEQIFFIYSDPAKEVNRVLDAIAGSRPPDLEAKDDYGETHRVWRIDDPAKVAFLQRFMDARECIIADGHHRYETSWNYHQEMLHRHVKAEGTETHENVLATLVNMDDDLTIFGTHRVVHGVAGFDLAKLLMEARSFFDIREYPFSGADEERSARVDFLEDLRIEGVGRPCFGLAARDAKSHYLFMVRDTKAAAAAVREKKSEDWRSLDVNILHTVVLDGLLGVGPEQLAAEQNVEFLRSADEAIDRVIQPGPAQASFLVNPVKIDQIKRVVKNRERFPQKSTDFYPKLLTGLLLCKLNS